MGHSQRNVAQTLRLASSCLSVLCNFEVGSCTYIYGTILILVKIGFYMQTYMRFSAKSQAQLWVKSEKFRIRFGQKKKTDALTLNMIPSLWPVLVEINAQKEANTSEIHFA